MFSKLKQYKDLRQQAKQLQNTLAEEKIEAVALSGRLKMVMDGNQKVQSVDIDPELLNVEQKEKLQDGIKDLVDNTIHEVQQKMAKKMRSGEINMPDLSNLGL